MDSLYDVIHGFYVVVLDVDNADGNIHLFGKDAKQFDFGKLPVGHFDVDLVDVEFEEVWQHWFDASESDGPSLKVSKAKMR